MKSEEITAQISALEKQLEVEADKLDAIVEKFRGELGPLAEIWMRKQVEAAVADQPAKIQALGIEKVKALKQKVNDLIAKLPEIAKQETSDKTYWPHRGGKTDDSSTLGEAFFDSSFRKVISHLGGVLSEFGLIEHRTGQPYQIWNYVSPGKFRYGINPGLRDQNRPTVTEYFNVKGKGYTRLVGEIQSAKIDLEKAKARELWESA
jgi:hypothetical protein